MTKYIPFNIIIDDELPEGTILALTINDRNEIGLLKVENISVGVTCGAPSKEIQELTKESTDE